MADKLTVESYLKLVGPLRHNSALALLIEDYNNLKEKAEHYRKRWHDCEEKLNAVGNIIKAWRDS